MSPPLTTPGAELRQGDRVAWLSLAVVLPIFLVAPALFPQLYWRRRLGWRGHLRFVAVETLWRTLGRHVLLPRAREFERRKDERRTQVRELLLAELGREPTADELDERGRALRRAASAAAQA